MNFGDMKDMVGILLGETNVAYITEPKKEAALNRVAPSIAQETEGGLFTRRVITPVVGQRNYSLWDDFLKIKSVYWNRDTSDNLRFDKLYLVSAERYEQLAYGSRNRQDNLRYYKIELGSVGKDDDPQIPGEIYVYPTPHTVSAEIHVHYFQKPTQLTTDAEFFEFDEGLHLAVCYKAAIILSYDVSDRVMAGDFQKLYDKEIFEYRRFKTDPNRDGAPHIIDRMGYSQFEDYDYF